MFGGDRHKVGEVLTRDIGGANIPSHGCKLEWGAIRPLGLSASLHSADFPYALS